ncbi:VTT domain-containing protein [Amylibacter sp.]|nr:VTT domain-containing protein [Amylibacter sp.]
MVQKINKFGFKYIFIFLLIIMIALVWYFFLRYYISYDFLAKNHNILEVWRDNNYNFTVITFIIIYITIVAFSLPGASMMSLTGGFLFATFPGTFFNVFSAVIGAALIFLAAKTFLGNILLDKIKGKNVGDSFLIKMQNEIQENEFSYLIILRLMPVVPFFVANLAPAFFGIKLRIFTITTLIGILPGTLVYTSIGASLSTIFKRNESPNLDIFSNPDILISSIGLFVLAIIPLVIKKIKKAR